MTIKNIGLSLATIATLGTAAFAGTVSVPTPGLIGQEKLSLADVNLTDVFKSVVYTPTDIPAVSQKNPIFKFTFTNGKNMNSYVDANASVWECQDGNETNTTAANWTMVAHSPQFSGTNNEIVSFNAISGDTYAYNNKKYIVADGNTTTVDANISSPSTTLGLLVVKGSTSDLKLQAQMYSGDSQGLSDTAPATTIAKVAPEYVGSVSSKYNARIDASLDFKKFYDQFTTSTSDAAKFNLHQNATLGGASLGVTAATLVLTFDQNLTKNAYTAVSATAGTNGGVSSAIVKKDSNLTDTIAGAFNITNAVSDNNETITLTVDGTSKIEKTIFDAHAYVTSGSNTFDLITKTVGNAGQWTIFGYNAQIPAVRGDSATSPFQTSLKFTNRSSIEATVYFTLIDQDGTVVSVASTEVANAAAHTLSVNETGKYNAYELKDLAVAKDANFANAGSFSLEVTIPTTPTLVYGFASYKNTDKNNFKDLPIYNTSTMTY